MTVVTAAVVHVVIATIEVEVVRVADVDLARRRTPIVTVTSSVVER